MSHTPGPWRYENEDGDRYIRSQDGTSLMCDMQCYPWAPQNKDDWNLIAAAPELLDAVKRVLAGFEANAFQRNTDGDHDPAWAIKFMPHLMALAAAARAVEKAEGTK